MKVVKITEVPRQPHVAPLFTSPDVTRQTIVSDSRELAINMVNFGKGVKNKLHSHSVDQVLIVTAGRGYVATEKEKRVVTVGDVIWFPAGEKHWHGATEDSELSHITVTQPGSKTTQFEQ